MSSLEFLKNPTITWFLIGLLIAMLELVIPGLVLIFFAIGAIITAFLCLFFDFSIAIQILIFSVASLISIFTLRKYIKERILNKEPQKVTTLEDEFIGKTVEVISDILPGKPGKVDFKGAPWKAVSDYEIKQGQTAKIIDKDSITLIVKP